MTSQKHMITKGAAKAALEFYRDHGVDVAVLDQADDKTVAPAPVASPTQQSPLQHLQESAPQSALAPSHAVSTAAVEPSTPLLGKSDARIESAKLAASCGDIDALKQAVQEFDGISLKKTATNLVFADGSPKAKIMLIGEAPGADEDRQGKPFAGANGDLLDKILGCIELSRSVDDLSKAVYLSNILNWRPPGNRTPSPAELEVSLPFIERHIQLVNPDMLILCGGVSAKALLGSSESLSKLRKKFHDYLPQTPELQEGAKPIPAIVTHHPAQLLTTPAQKRNTWADMLMLQAKLSES